MRIAKPILLVTTPVGVFWGLYEAYQVSPGLAFLMGALVGFIGVAIGITVSIARREQREAREKSRMQEHNAQ